MKSIFSLEQYTKIFPRLKRKLSESSQFEKKLIESRKLRSFYKKPSQKYLQMLYKKSYCFSQTSSSFFCLLESRLDVVLYRAHFFESIATAKQQIRVGQIEVNNKKVVSPGYNVIPGDIIQVLPSCKEISHANEETAVFKTSSKESLYFPKKYRKKDGWRFQKSPFLVSLFALQFKKAIDTADNTTQYCNDKKTAIFKTKAIANNLLARLSKISFKDFLVADIKKMWCSENRFKFGALSRFRMQNVQDSKKVYRFEKENFPLANQKQNDGSNLFVQQTKNKPIDFSFLSKPLSKKEESLKTYRFKNASLLNDNKKLFLLNNWLFLNFLLFLKKQAISSRKKSFCFFQQKNQLFFENQSFFQAKKTKPLHLEISYRSRCIVFLFPPQRVCFPSFIDLSQIYK